MKTSYRRAIALGLASASSLALLTDLADSAQAQAMYVGDTIFYDYGYVQVVLTVDSAGKIIDIKTPIISTEPVTRPISAFALPVLVSEALTAQSADISAVSGASYLSAGWKTSLASAIAKMPVKPVASEPSSTPSPAASPVLGLVPHASVIQKTIICIKGSLKKTVKGSAPKCPAGYTLKK